MQTIGPYALQDLLGVGPVGRIWRGYDQQGNWVTVAMLEGQAAGDQQLRSRLTGTVEQLRAASTAVPVNADLAGPQPWAAYADDGGATAANVFAALGAPCTPVTAPAAGPASAQQPGSVQPGLIQQPGMVQQTGAGSPQGPLAAEQPTPLAPQPAGDQAAALDPFSASGPAAPAEPVNPFAPQPPVSSAPAQFSPVPEEPASYAPQPGPGQQYPPPDRFDQDSTPRRRHTGLIIGVAVVVVILLVGGIGGAIYLTRDNGSPDAETSSSPSPVASHRKTSSPAPTPHTQKSAPSTPKDPGQEPPKAGSWPASFATFGAKDATKKLSDLAGLGFTLTVPTGWSCTKKDQSTSYVNYHCGNGQDVGGDVIVRTCGEPCSSSKKITMRSEEEAWGLQWVRDGGNCSYADSSSATGEDGKKAYGLAMVRYWHSRAGGPMDRQLVLRLTAPKSHADQVQKVANSARDATQ